MSTTTLSKYERLESQLLEKYGYNTPIVLKDIDSVKEFGVEPKTFQTYLGRMCKRSSLQRFDRKRGVYYFAEMMKYINKRAPLSEDKVVLSAYVTDGDEVYGYLSGYNFVNYLGLTSQVPYVVEIKTNKISRPKVEEMCAEYRISKSRVEVTAKNYRLLEILDLLLNCMYFVETKDIETKEIVAKYLEGIEVTKTEFFEILEAYPARTSFEILKQGFTDLIFDALQEDNVPAQRQRAV